MSKLNDLITKLCPDGVPYKPMWAITTWDKKFNGVDKKKQPAINKHHYYLAKELEPLIVLDGDIKVLTTSPSDLYTTAELAKDNIKDGEIVAIPCGGNAIVQYYNGKYITSDNRIAIVNDEEQLNCKFLYYVLKNKEKELAKYYRGAGIKHPNMFKVLHMEIPLPPLPVQSEIVRILDSFTELEAELEAELAGRKEQYEYYRDRLLSQKNLEAMGGKPVEMMKLGDVSRVFGGYAFKSKEYTVSGARVMRISDVQAGYISNENAKYCPIDQPKQADSARLFANDLLVSLTGNVGRVAMVDNTVLPAYLNQRVAGLRATDAINYRFLFHYLNQHQFIADCERAGKGSAQKNLSMGYLTNYEIPVPSLATQERIVDILDRFDALTTSLTDGIPAEIAMRREQYEYYRSRLLDFPRLPEDSDSDNE